MAIYTYIIYNDKIIYISDIIYNIIVYICKIRKVYKSDIVGQSCIFIVYTKNKADHGLFV